jgi:hypothetical protein
MLEDSAMEMNSQPQKFIYTDALAKLDRDNYRREILATEFMLPEATDETDGPLPSEPLEKLDESLGFGEEEVMSHYTGIAYKLDKNGLLKLDKPVFLDQELTFCGTGYYDVEEKWRILFEFRDDSSQKMHEYATPFDAMARLAIVESRSEKYDISQTLKHHAELSKILTCDPGFYTAPARQQMEILKSVAMSCSNKLLQTINPEDISVETPIFYVHPDNAEEKQFTVTCVDQAHENFEDRTAVIGDMIGVIYLEVCLDPGRSFASASEFFVGGAPCMVVRNETQGTTSYIPIDKIESIEQNG